VSPTPPGQTTFQLRIQLQDVRPIVWRRLLVPGAIRLSKCADILCAAMGWENYHLHQFRVGRALYGMHVEEHAEREIDEKTVSVLQAFRDERRFFFDYDFGDSWEHEVVVESISRTPLGLKFAVCVDGQNACPPEDVGGVPGYEEFLGVIADPTHEEHEHYVGWSGGSFDPTDFDLAEVNARLQKVR
jgi:hypothetical protein